MKRARPIVGTLVVIALLALYAVVLRGRLEAQEPRGALERALLVHVRLGFVRADGSHTYVLHCRRAHGGCEARVRRMAAMFERAAFDHHVDAWLLAAIAMRESGGNPDAIGARNEFGLMQLHPGSRHGRFAAELCRARPRECSIIVVDAAARLLRSAIERCGDEASALGLYNSGRCGVTEYSRSVLARREALRRAGA
jgi:hypothetical protein